MRDSIGRTWILALAASMTLAIAPGAPASSMCKWVDENGTVHYAERCPEGVESSDVTIDAGAPPPAADDPYAASRVRMQQRATAPPAAKRPAAQADYSRMSASQLARECEQQRQARLAPERKRLIDECKAGGDQDPGYCERYYASYGDGGRQGGRTVPRMYDNLPVCVAAREKK